MRREVLTLLSNEKVTYIEFQGDLWVTSSTSFIAKIEDLEEWRSTKKDVPSSLLIIKSYYISVHTLATIEC